MSIMTIFLTLCLIFVNGWTDAPNAIVSVVSGGALSYKKAVLMAAVCNMLGVLVSCFISSSVANTITSMVSFGGEKHALRALLCVMATVIIFAVAAWVFGIPTSESHALIGALMGSAIAVNPYSGIDTSVAMPVVAGLVASVGAGFITGAALGFATKKLPKMTKLSMKAGSICCGGLLSFLHGAQDGQKFVAVLVMARAMASGAAQNTGAIIFSENIASVLMVGGAMSLGTLVGGKRIIDTVGGKMVNIDMSLGLSSDIATIGNLLVSTAMGMPVSTTHAKTSTMIGCAVGAGTGADTKVVGRMFFTWVITLPACAIIAYLLTIVSSLL